VTIQGDVEVGRESYLEGLKEFKDGKAREQGEKLPHITKLQVNSFMSLSTTSRIESKS